VADGLRIGLLGLIPFVIEQLLYGFVGCLEEWIDPGEGKCDRPVEFIGQQRLAGRQQSFLDKLHPLFGEIVCQTLFLCTPLAVDVFLPDHIDFFDIFHDLIGVKGQSMVMHLDDVRVARIMLE